MPFVSTLTVDRRGNVGIMGRSAVMHNLLQPLPVKWGSRDGLVKLEPHRPALTLRDFSEGWKDVSFLRLLVRSLLQTLMLTQHAGYFLGNQSTNTVFNKLNKVKTCLSMCNVPVFNSALSMPYKMGVGATE